MRVDEFVDRLSCEFFAGVPDSQLKALCDYLYVRYGIGENHHIAHNEGGALALASGYYLATGKIPCVYLQNSGIGNIINPVCSLTSTEVYGIPTIFVIGWRGEPNVKDEPQHIYQGKITLELLKILDIEYYIIDKDTKPKDIDHIMETRFNGELEKGRSVAFVVRKGGLLYDNDIRYANEYSLGREEAIEMICKYADDKDVFISTTGKASRELFEIREKNKNGHKQDFLTVGSMGHASMIAMGIAEKDRKRRVWCIDGDGSSLMHLGAMAIVGSNSCDNMVHIILNNQAHESVGGMPTVSKNVNYEKIADACGYKNIFKATNMEELKSSLEKISLKEGATLLEVKVGIGSRADLGRPTTTPYENKKNFMEFLKKGDV